MCTIRHAILLLFKPILFVCVCLRIKHVFNYLVRQLKTVFFFSLLSSVFLCRYVHANRFKKIKTTQVLTTLQTTVYSCMSRFACILCALKLLLLLYLLSRFLSVFVVGIHVGKSATPGSVYMIYNIFCFPYIFLRAQHMERNTLIITVIRS